MLSHPDASLPFVRTHAQEMADDVISRHIDTYVNEYSVSLGVHGRYAVALLFQRGNAAGILPTIRDDIFL